MGKHNKTWTSSAFVQEKEKPWQDQQLTKGFSRWRANMRKRKKEKNCRPEIWGAQEEGSEKEETVKKRRKKKKTQTEDWGEASKMEGTEEQKQGSPWRWLADQACCQLWWGTPLSGWFARCTPHCVQSPCLTCNPACINQLPMLMSGKALWLLLLLLSSLCLACSKPGLCQCWIKYSHHARLSQIWLTFCSVLSCMSMIIDPQTKHETTHWDSPTPCWRCSWVFTD